MAGEKKERSGEEEAGGNPITRLVTFFSDAWKELKKVHRPTREETIQLTVQVLIVIAVFSSFLGAVDLLIGWIMHEMLT